MHIKNISRCAGHLVKKSYKITAIIYEIMILMTVVSNLQNSKLARDDDDDGDDDTMMMMIQ